MKTVAFKQWTLSQLDKAFGLYQVVEGECEILKNWQAQAKQITISETEKQFLIDLRTPLIWGGKAWNEVELENKFISPLIMLAKIDDRTIGYFLERPLSAEIGDYALSGVVDGMIAKGFRDPDVPYFCMHEYKRSIDHSGNPDAQALAAMLAARQINQNQKSVYGLFIVGYIWNFMVLNSDNSYCISQDYNASNQDIFDLFAMMKAIKIIIKNELFE